ncbi:MAG TPA: potassium-transporting ATPase subunit C [Caldilineae bacterium]|nr:potassium-transporting ATPase subunit C [Caldilineae bacterium]
MATKVRKQVYIEPHQDLILKRLAKERGLTEAEIIRQAIDQHTRSFRSPWRNLAAWEEERAFIEGLIQQGPVAGKRTWHREDLHER